MFAAKSKRLRDEAKTEEMNRFVNRYFANLSEKEKKLPFLTNHARALKAFSEQSVSDAHKSTVRYKTIQLALNKVAVYNKKVWLVSF